MKQFATIALVVCAMPAAVYYTIQVCEFFKAKIQKSADKCQHDKLTHDTVFKVPTYKVVWLNLLALMGAIYLISIFLEIMTTVPQAGLGGPLPRWLGNLICMWHFAFATRWIFLGMLDIDHRLHPENSKKPYTKALRARLGMLFFVMGLSIPWLYDVTLPLFKAYMEKKIQS